MRGQQAEVVRSRSRHVSIVYGFYSSSFTGLVSSVVSVGPLASVLRTGTSDLKVLGVKGTTLGIPPTDLDFWISEYICQNFDLYNFQFLFF